MKVFLFFIHITLISILADSRVCANDTLSLETYLDVVLDNHPLIQRAHLFDDITEAYELKGKGALDPKLSSNYDRKDFNNTDYFTIWQSEAKIPTVLPVDLAVGYERNDGVFLSDQNSVPKHGLVYGTINLSVLRGLLFDDQRYNMRLSEVNGIKSQIEKEIVIREIIYQAINAYLDWAKAQNEFNINQNYLQLVRDRHQNVLELFENGANPAMDTIESRLNINSANKIYISSNDKLIKSTQKVSLFVWDLEGNPLQLNAEVKPDEFRYVISKLREMSLLINPEFVNDPLIMKIDIENESIQLANRLERENLKPQLDLKYNFIVDMGKDNLAPSFSPNDYKYGVGFQYPILNRKSRGEIKLNESIMQQNEFDKLQYLGTLNNKFEGLVSRVDLQDEMLSVVQEKIDNSQLLYEAEQLKFSLGESSVFLLNQRERKLLEARTELVKNYTSLGVILNELYYLKLGQ